MRATTKTRANMSQGSGGILCHGRQSCSNWVTEVAQQTHFKPLIFK